MVERYADFKTMKEDWNEYKLEDGTTIKIKTILIKLINQPNGFGINSTNAIGVFVPSDIVGTPSKTIYSPQELEQSIVKKDLKFDIVKEDWNVYQLKDGSKLSIKPVLVAVSRTNKYDPNGEPLYQIQAQQMIKKI